MIVFAIILLIIAVGSFAVGSLVCRNFKKQAAETQDNYYKKSYLNGAKVASRVKWIVSLIAVALLIISMLIAGIRIIDSTEVGVVRTFGRIDHQITSGFNLVNPISDTVSVYDLRVHVREESFASYTRDAQPVTASIEYQYQLDPAYVMDVAQEYGTYEILESKLANVIQEKAKIVFAKYSAMPLLENRSTLSAEVKTEVETLEELFHVNFTSVIVKDLDFSDAFEASVEAKMTAEQDALRAEQEKKTAIVKAEQAKEVAAINAEAAIAEAKGEAEAIEIKRQALQNMPDAYIQSLWIEKWNGILPTTQAGSEASIIVNPNMD